MLPVLLERGADQGHSEPLLSARGARVELCFHSGNQHTSHETGVTTANEIGALLGRSGPEASDALNIIVF